MIEKPHEHFPMLVDQEIIDNYLWYRKTLEEFRKKKIIVLERNANWKQLLRVFESRKNDDMFQYFKVKKALKENEQTLLRIERNIEELEDIVERNSVLEYWI